MKIESTKNIIKQIEGTNTFEVKTVGKRKDLEELRDRLELHGVKFDENGEFKGCCHRTEELIKLVKDLTGDEKINRKELIETIFKDAKEYISLYEDLRKKDFEFIYTLDMSNIEILTEEDRDGKITAKAIFNLKTNDDTEQLLFWEEVGSKQNIEEMKNTEGKYIDVDSVLKDILVAMNCGMIIGGALKGVSEKIKNPQVVEELKQLGIDIGKSNIRANDEFKALEEILLETARFNDEDIMKVSKTLAGEYNTNHLVTLIKNYKNN